MSGQGHFSQLHMEITYKDPKKDRVLLFLRVLISVNIIRYKVSQIDNILNFM